MRTAFGGKLKATSSPFYSGSPESRFEVQQIVNRLLGVDAIVNSHKRELDRIMLLERLDLLVSCSGSMSADRYLVELEKLEMIEKEIG